MTKSQRFTDTSGTATSTRIELDPFGGDTSASANGNSQPYKYTSYERDGNGSDYAMARSRNTWFSRFYQPDPYDGSYNMADPQSFNRYAYTQNDPVNFVDPSGLLMKASDGGFCGAEYSFSDCGGWGGIYGGYFGGDYAAYNRIFEGIPEGARDSYAQYQKQREFDAFMSRLPPGAHYIGGVSWGWTDYSKDMVPSYTYSFSTSRGLDAYFSNKLAVIYGGLRTPAQGGPPGGSLSFPDGIGGRTDRFYGDDGRALKDVDYGHDHGAGDPHVHDWDWTKTPPRQPGRAPRPGEPLTNRDYGNPGFGIPYERGPSPYYPGRIPIMPINPSLPAIPAPAPIFVPAFP